MQNGAAAGFAHSCGAGGRFVGTKLEVGSLARFSA